MFIGEAPGADEDRLGEPFVGRAGQLTTQLLRAAHVPEADLYFANILKCRPTNNRFPEGGPEPETCRRYLLKQIKHVAPHAIVLAGKQALRYVLLHGTDKNPHPIHPWVNKVYRRRDLYGDILFLVVYHPAYLLRSEVAEDQEACVQSVAQIWEYAKHKVAGTPPAPVPFEDIAPAPIPPRMGRNLFGSSRGKTL